MESRSSKNARLLPHFRTPTFSPLKNRFRYPTFFMANFRQEISPPRLQGTRRFFKKTLRRPCSRASTPIPQPQIRTSTPSTTPFLYSYSLYCLQWKTPRPPVTLRNPWRSSRPRSGYRLFLRSLHFPCPRVAFPAYADHRSLRPRLRTPSKSTPTASRFPSTTRSWIPHPRSCHGHSFWR